MLRQQVVVIASERMDASKKTNENQLVRIPKKARQSMDPKSNMVEVYRVGNKAVDRFVNSRILKIHQAYSTDIKKANQFITSGVLNKADKNKLCFISSDTFKRLTGQKYSGEPARINICDSIVDTLVGADPEFVLKDRSGLTVNANNVLRMQNWRTSPLGVDNYGLQVEIRPEPEILPVKLVNRMQDILKKDKNVASIADYEWKACSYDSFGIGGHIHFGTPTMLEYAKGVKYGFFVVATRILDELVALPFCKVEAEGGVTRRSRTRFGLHGDFRKDTGRLEWRVLGGDWVAHPDLAEAVLGTAKAVCEEVHRLIDASGFELDFVVPKKYQDGDWASYKGPDHNQDTRGRIHFWRDRFDYRTKAQNNWAAWPICESFGLEKSSSEIANELHNGKPTVASLKRTYAILRNMSTYPEYKKQIERFIKICSMTKKSLSNLNRDMRETWLNGKKMFK
jgi:hypothetical protein